MAFTALVHKLVNGLSTLLLAYKLHVSHLSFFMTLISSSTFSYAVWTVIFLPSLVMVLILLSTVLLITFAAYSPSLLPTSAEYGWPLSLFTNLTVAKDPFPRVFRTATQGVEVVEPVVVKVRGEGKGRERKGKERKGREREWSTKLRARQTFATIDIDKAGGKTRPLRMACINSPVNSFTWTISPDSLS